MPLSRQQRLSYRRFRIRQRRNENIYFKQFRAFFNKLNKEVSQSYNNSGDWKKLVDKADFEGLYTKLYQNLSIQEAKKHFDNEIKPILPGEKADPVTDAGNEIGAGTSAGRRIEIWRRLVREYMEANILERIKEVRETTKDHIALLIKKGIDEGIHPDETAKIIRNDFKFTRNRSIAIARTETISAMNQGKMMSSASTGYEMEKAWIPAFDSRTRDTHADMDPDNWIDINDHFMVGGEMAMQPGDSNLSAGEVVNCRCSVSFRVKTDSNGRAIRK